MSKYKGGAGSIYQRGDGRWCAALDLGAVDGVRKRKVITSLDRNVVAEKLAALTVDAKPVQTRAEYMLAAKAKATHTPTEWHAKIASSPKTCRYCDTQLHHFNRVMDHMVAVEAGGSDGIDNLQPICWECNGDKRTTHHDEYVFTGEKPRPFSVLPIRRPEYERVMEKEAERKGRPL